MSSEKKEFNVVHLVKGVAIIGVVFHHIANRRLSAEVTDSISNIQAVFSWSVLMFVAIAGWLHAISEEKRKISFGSFAKARFFRLLVPYFLLVLFYASIWQLLQVIGVSGVGVRLSDSYFEKVYCSFVPECYEPVAEQLYFLPVIFFISMTTKVFLLVIGGRQGAFVLLGASLVLSLGFVPDSKNTGLSFGFFLFGLYCYSSAYLLYAWREDWRCIPCVSICAILILLLLGVGGVPKVVPVLLVILFPVLDKVRVTWLERIGMASGTIYAYHTPFVLQPLVIIASGFSKSYQLAGAVSSAIVATLVCAAFYHCLKSTRARVLLM